MDIVHIHTHDTGRFIEPYGYPVSTPNLMRLARNGIVFRNCFNAGPTCSPSRAALLTGQYPHQCGMWGLAHRGFSLADPTRHLASFPSRNGYETALCGVQHETSWNPVVELGYGEGLRGDPGRPSGASDEHAKAADMMMQERANARAAADFVRRPHERPPFL